VLEQDDAGEVSGCEPFGEIVDVLLGDQTIDVTDDVAQRREVVVVALDLDDHRSSVVALGHEDDVDDPDRAAVDELLERRQYVSVELTSREPDHHELERRSRHDA
jgi:hypothetical protein